MRKLIETIMILFCAIAAMNAQTAQNAPAAPAPDGQVSQSLKTSAGDPRTNLAKMRILLGQMQRNVAFVTPGDTPLKHQLELEIEMWQILIADMEQRLNSQQAAPAK